MRHVLVFFLIWSGFSCHQLLAKNHALSEPSSSLARIEELNTLRNEGLMAIDTCNYRKAQQIFQQILATHPEAWLDLSEVNSLLISLAASQLHLKLLDEALRTLSKLFPEGMTSYIEYHNEILKAYVFEQKGELQEAMLFSNRLLEKMPLDQWELKDQRFYLKLNSQLNSQYEELILQADRCFEGALYQESSNLYQEILESLNKGVYKQNHNVRLPFQVRIRLAYCQFQQENFQRAKELLLQAKNIYPAIFESDSFLQLIVCCKNLGQYEEALNLCDEYMVSKFSNQQQDLVLFEAGRIHTQLGHLEEAKKFFLKLIDNQQSSECQSHSRICLARIYLKEKAYTQVESILNRSQFNFERTSHLKFEWAYLRAEALYQRKEYELAAVDFKESLEHPKIKQADWYRDALYHLGFSYLKLGEDALSQDISKKDFLLQAEGYFQELLEHESTDRGVLALARTYLMRSYYLSETGLVAKMIELFNSHTFEKIETQLEAGFILADVTQDNQRREAIYEHLTSELFKEALNYGKAHYFQGVFYCNLCTLDPSLETLQKAVASLKKGMALLEKSFPSFTLLAAQKMVQASLNFSDPQILVQVEQDLEIISSKATKESFKELNYLRAEVCLRLMQNGDMTYFEKGIQALDILDCPDEERSQFLRARFYFKSQQFARSKLILQDLIENHPQSPLKGDSLFWVAQCIEMEGGDPRVVKEMRRKVFKDYPDCPLAAEAYFLYYSFAQYLDGSLDALEHLKGMELEFGQSPYVITASYLLGLNYKSEHKKLGGSILLKKDLNLAITFFQQAKERFLSCWAAGQIPAGNYHYFISVYYRSTLEQAQVYLEKADQSQGAKRHIHLAKSLEFFNEVYGDFADTENVRTRFLLKEDRISKIYEEASFGRALCYAKNGQIEEAENAFGQLIEQYAAFKMEQGHYLSRAWYELAMIAMAKKEYQDALEYFFCAERSISAQLLNADQKIDLGIQQSLCYRFLEQYDMAMLTLSKVINEGVISNLRVKAMFLRAEIYELQGKRELAQKQLNVASKKGGEWGKMSQEKLFKEYGFNE